MTAELPPILDFRSRPPLPEFAGYPTNPERIEGLTARLGFRRPAAAANGSIDLWFEEIATAHISKVVVLGRATPMQFVPNERIAEFTRSHSDRTIGFGAVDVLGIAHDPVLEIERSVKALGLSGVSVDPGNALQRGPKQRAGIHFDDPLMVPIYAKCVEMDVPIVLLTGPYAGNDLSYTDPARIDRVAAWFPELRIVCGHGCWPYAAEIVAVAYKHINVYISPDIYFSMPGGQAYREAMSHQSLHRQMLFASCYPLRRFDDAVEEIAALDLPPEHLVNILGANAKRVLGSSRRAP